MFGLANKTVGKVKNVFFSPHTNHCARKYCSTRTEERSEKFRDPVRQVFISQSNDVFTNLALEDWLYRNHDFDHKHLLLLWRNDPCVVIGRHQNPWTEANVPFLRDNSIDLARRNSGGGTVYHDLGNLNCTFFTRRSAYDRRRNLDVICSAIQQSTNLDVAVNHREDIVLDDTHKISGTAAKLGKDSAYHHCTVLVDVNECVLHDALNSQAEGVESRATQSVRVPVRNLAAVDPNVDIKLLQEAVGWQFLRTNIDGDDEGPQVAARQRGFQNIRPDNNWFPGLDKLRQEFHGQHWIFGKTPKFKVSKRFPIPSALLASVTCADDPELVLELEVIQGRVQDVRVQLPQGLLDPELVDLSEVLLRLPFNENLARAFGQQLQEQQQSGQMSPEKKTFLVTCIEEMINKFT